MIVDYSYVQIGVVKHMNYTLTLMVRWKPFGWCRPHKVAKESFGQLIQQPVNPLAIIVATTLPKSCHNKINPH